MRVRALTFDWLKELVEAAVDGSPIFEAEVHPTEYGKLAKVKTLQVGPCVSKFAPMPGGAMGEFDVRLTLLIIQKVAGRENPAAHDEALMAVEDMGAKLAGKLFLDNTMNGRVRDSVSGDFPRTITTIDNHPHALGNLQLFVNVVGQQVVRDR